MPTLAAPAGLDPDHIDLIRDQMADSPVGAELVVLTLDSDLEDTDEMAVGLELIAAAAEDLATSADGVFDPTSPWATALLAMPAGHYRRRGRLWGWLRPITAVVHDRLGDRPDRWFAFGAEVERAGADTPISVCVDTVLRDLP